MWGTIDNDGASGGAATGTLRYFNTATNRWINLSPTVTLTGNPNALSGDPGSGILYYVDRTGLTLRSYNLNTGVEAQVGATAIGAAGLPVGIANTVGATFTNSGQLFLYLTENGGTNREYVGRVNLTTPANTTWTQILTTGGANPALGNSGDMYTDNSGFSIIASNTTPNTLWSIDLNPASGTYARTTQTLALSTSLGNLWGIAINPIDGLTYAGANQNGSVTYVINLGTGNMVLLDNQAVYGVTDMGNCVAPPARPTVTKTFSPAYQPLTGATTTLSISIANSNSVPIWLTTDFKDVLPTGLVIGPVPSLNAGGCSASATVTNTITATAGQNTVTFTTGGRIPAGGCTISFAVSATASTSAYTNTIPAGSLTTTAGSNATGATATYKVGTDFSAGKSQCLNTCGTTSTSVITVPGGQTLQYILTVTNSAQGGTGSVTFTDTLPSLMTPVLSITAAMTGGGTCTSATAVVGGATRVTGTVTNAPPGAACSVTVTSLVSKTQSVATNVTNTMTIAALAGTTDTVNTNNTATVPTTVGPSALLSITKTNSVSSVPAGGTFNYTITVVNSGPAAAAGTTVSDPPPTGLSCTTVTCTAAGSVSCPASPFPFSVLSSGVQLTPTFAASSTATFVVTCGTTATGF
ncbi:hypothetical protein BH11PSE7_BH11PSE7_23400 [soil metagenome]